MRKFCAVLIAVVGVCLSLYLGGVVMFVGGIVDIVETIKADVEPYKIAVGIAKVVLLESVL